MGGRIIGHINKLISSVVYEFMDLSDLLYLMWTKYVEEINTFKVPEGRCIGHELKNLKYAGLLQTFLERVF
jgi:hypothetical protein